MSERHDRRAWPLLRHRADTRSLGYLIAQPVLMGWQWWQGFSWPLFVLSLVLAVGVGVIHHNHAHLPIWRRTGLNRATDLWITLLQGHPTCVFVPAHTGNHHRYRHGPGDVSATWRWGDHNHLVGWLWHPFQALTAVYPLIVAWLARLWRRSPRRLVPCGVQYALWLASWAVLLWLDAGKALAIVIVPQLIGLHWLLAANYLQHAHADGRSRWNYARNFEGRVNRLWFNIGLHTAHHEAPRRHWSDLPALHARLRERIHPALIERSFGGYVWRVFVLGLVRRDCRSRSLMSPPCAQDVLSGTGSMNGSLDMTGVT